MKNFWASFSVLFIFLFTKVYSKIDCVENFLFEKRHLHHRKDHGHVIKVNGLFKDAGQWHGPFYCPEGEYVGGLSLTAENFQGSNWCVQKDESGGCRENPYRIKNSFDDNGVIALKFFCVRMNQTTGKLASKLISGCEAMNVTVIGREPSEKEENFAELWDSQRFTGFCPNSSVATGVIIRMQEEQGKADDAAITNVKLRCSDDEVVYSELDYDRHVYGVKEVDFDDGKDSCPPGQALCGLKVRTIFDHHDDNTGLTDVHFYCCKLPEMKRDSAPCKASTKWTQVNNVENAGTTLQEYSYTVTTGVVNESVNRKMSSNSSSSGTETGYGLELEAKLGAFGSIKTSFQQAFSSSSASGSENENSVSESFQKEETHTNSIKIGAKRRIQILQLVGECGGIKVNSGSFKYIETCMEGYEYQCDELVKSVNQQFSNGAGHLASQQFLWFSVVVVEILFFLL